MGILLGGTQIREKYRRKRESEYCKLSFGSSWSEKKFRDLAVITKEVPTTGLLESSLCGGGTL